MRAQSVGFKVYAMQGIRHSQFLSFLLELAIGLGLDPLASVQMQAFLATPRQVFLGDTLPGNSSPQ
jgi:hypothetical protein